MEEVVILNCKKSLRDVETFLKRAGRYVDSGYQLESFKAEEGLEAVFVIKDANPVGFQDKEVVEPVTDI